jgi:hypothetical protein
MVEINPPSIWTTHKHVMTKFFFVTTQLSMQCFWTNLQWWKNFSHCTIGDGKFSIVVGLVTENSWSPPLIWQWNFQSPSLWWLKIFHHQLCDDWKSFVATSLVIEIFWSPQAW